jgi:cytochrome c biogenesis protein CcmG, thiol:disulfide interchange protein DsbE
MTKNITLLLLILFIGALYTYISDFKATPVRQDKEEYIINVTSQQPIPDFFWTGMNGKNYAISEFKGKVIVLNFWATWCAPCVIEFPMMVELAKKKNPEAVFLFISVDEDQDTIRRFLKKYGDEENAKNVFIGWDRNKEISMDLFGTVKLPETYLITPSMMISEKIIGADVDWTGQKMEDKIEALYAE